MRLDITLIQKILKYEYQNNNFMREKIKVKFLLIEKTENKEMITLSRTKTNLLH